MKFTGFIPHFSAPFNMETSASMRELIENLTHFYRTLELTADAASIIYQHKVLADRLHSLEKDHNDMLTQIHNYVNSLANVKLNSTLNQRLANQLVVDDQPHPVLVFKPKLISDGMPVFGASDAIPGHIQLLEQHFLTRFPIHFSVQTRRQKYFSHMIQKINEGELLQTPVHDTMASFLATNCPDSQLCLELLHSDYSSLNGMVNRALTY